MGWERVLRLMIGTAVLGLGFVARSDAATIAVDSTADDATSNGNCTLREAVLAANANSARDACPAGSDSDVVLVPAGTYVLTRTGTGEELGQTGDLDVRGSLEVRGAGADVTTIDANGIDRVFDVGAANVTLALTDVTVRGGRLTGTSTEGAGIKVNFSGARVELRRVALVGNQIDVSGPGTGSVFAARGAGLYATTTAQVVIEASEISGNRLLSRPLGSQAQLGIAEGGGLARLRLDARGAALPAYLPVPPAGAVTVQLVTDQASAAGCWEAVYPAPPRESAPDRFEDRLP